MLERYKDMISKLRRIYHVALVAIIVSAGAGLTHAEELIYGLQLQCGMTPKGKVLYDGKFHKEILGETFEHKEPTIPSPSMFQRRFAVLKKNNCWIEFTALPLFEPNERATGTFMESYLRYAAGGVGVGDFGMASRVDIADFIIKISPVAAECGSTYSSVLQHFLGLDRRLNGEEIVVHSQSRKVFLSCLKAEAQKLDRRGFVGAWLRHDSPLQGFAWIDGEIYFYGEE